MSSNADLSGWRLTGSGGTLAFEFVPGTFSYSVKADNSVNGLSMLLTPADTYSVIYVNGAEADPDSGTVEYSLATGSNTFEVVVKRGWLHPDVYAQCHACGCSASHSGSGSSSVNTPAGNEIAIWINNQKLSGIASIKADASGEKLIEAVLDADHIT